MPRAWAPNHFSIYAKLTLRVEARISPEQNPMNNTTKHRCALIAAREPLIRFGIRKLLETQECLNVIAEAPSISEAASMVEKLKPDLLLLDFSTFEGGLRAIRDLTFIRPSTCTIVIVRSAENNRTSEALASGARGVIPRGSPTEILLDCVRTVLAGRCWSGEKTVPALAEGKPQFPLPPPRRRTPNGYGLTPRELDVIGTILNGCSNKDVGKQFSISERTVKHHLSNIFQKLEVSSRLELAVFALNHGFGKE